jgi:hypothetical protein
MASESETGETKSDFYLEAETSRTYGFPPSFTIFLRRPSTSKTMPTEIKNKTRQSSTIDSSLIFLIVSYVCIWTPWKQKKNLIFRHLKLRATNSMALKLKEHGT